MRKQVWKPNNRQRNTGLMESLGLHGIHEGERETDRQTDRQTERETERDRERVKR